MTTGNPSTMTTPDAYAVPSATNESAAAGLFETTIVTTQQQLDIGNGQLANLEVYNGTAPGPTLFMDKDDTVVVRLVNKLPHASGIHWHGIELASGADGTPVTQDGLVASPAQTLGTGEVVGGTYLYKFTAPRPGLYWYHPHHFHSTNRVFRQTFGMIVVADPNEATLITNGTLPAIPQTFQLVLSDITVCNAVGMNATRTHDTTLPWVNGATLPNQDGPTPQALCETNPVDEHGDPRVDAAMNPLPFNQFDVPNIQQGGRVNEGQIALTNGVYVGGRAGTPEVPGALDATAQTTNVAPGQGIRLQIVNTATTRYFRLVLKVQTGTGVQTVPLIRVGGEGGLLDQAIVEGGTVGGFVTKFESGEIVLPPASRADVVAVIPTDATGVATVWTLDYQRTGQASANNWSNIPSVPIMHLNVTGAVQSFTMAAGTNILASIGAAVPVLPTPTGSFISPPAGKPGLGTLRIELQSGPRIDTITGSFAGFPDFQTVPHIGSTRYAALDADLTLTVGNTTNAHHPFHLHGFSFQPLMLTHDTDATKNFSWTYNEFRDNVDIPPAYTLTAKVHFEDRGWHDGTTIGGGFGRWLFHCHIFHHAHKGMISELVVTTADGVEKPHVSVGGSWEYAPIPGTARRSGKFSHPDSLPVTLTSHFADGTPVGTVTTIGSTWDWALDTTGMTDTIDYVYITASDGTRTSQAVFKLQVGGTDTGSDNGDPHLHTIDGQQYDFQAVGEFVLLRDSEGLEVQVRQTPVPSQNPIHDAYTGLRMCVSVNTAVALRAGINSISYQPGAEPGQLDFFINGKLSELPKQGFIALDGAQLSTFNADGATGLRVDYAHSAVVQVTPKFWTSHNIWYMNIQISSVSRSEGLMAPIAKGSWLPALPSGEHLGPQPKDLHERWVQLYQVFANVWRVTAENSMFSYPAGVSTETFTDRNWPNETLPCTVKPGLEITGAPILTGLSIAEAEQICAFLTDDGLRQDCVFDVAVTGEKQFADGYRFLAELRARSTAVTLEVEEEERGGKLITVLVAKVRLLSGGPAKSGSVVFWDGNDRLSDAVAVDVQGTSRWTPDAKVEGDHTVTAVYTDAADDHFESASVPAEIGIVAPKPSAPLFKWLWLLILLILLVLAGFVLF